MQQSIQSTIAETRPPTMTVDDAAAFLRISRSTAYTLSARYRQTGGHEGLANVRLGTRVLVLTAPLLELVRVSAREAIAQPAFVAASTTSEARPRTTPDVA